MLRYHAGPILFIVLIGLVPICRGGEWHWTVVPQNAALNAAFWVGWLSALVVGLLSLVGLFPAGHDR
jgi:hypothetical protein